MYVLEAGGLGSFIPERLRNLDDPPVCFRSGSEGGGHLKGRRDTDIIPAERHSSDTVGGESASQCSDQA